MDNQYPRSELDRRNGERRGRTLQERECLRCCRFAGVVFQGIQKGFAQIPDIVLFARNPNATTLCLPAANLTPLAIREKLLDSEKVRRQVLERYYPRAMTATAGSGQHSRTA